MDEPTAQEMAAYKKAGRIASSCLGKGASLIVPGAQMSQILDQIETMIAQQGGKPAFPAQVAVNNVAAHYCPTDEDDYIFEEGDIAKLDIGVHVDGYVADTAMSVNLGDHDELSRASKDALEHALKLARPGITLGEIGKTIQETISSYGYKPIHNLSGHGLGRFAIHTRPSIPNVATNDPTELEENMVIAIEPFASTGKGEIFESAHPTLFSEQVLRQPRNRMTRQVAQTIKTYDHLPFTTRWLTRKHGAGVVRFALRELMQSGSITAHPPLPDQQGSFVSQHEHSVIVGDKPLVYTKNQ